MIQEYKRVPHKKVIYFKRQKNRGKSVNTRMETLILYAYISSFRRFTHLHTTQPPLLLCAVFIPIFEATVNS